MKFVKMDKNLFALVFFLATSLLGSISAHKLVPRLARGTPSYFGQFPFFAFLDIEHEDGLTQIGGGSLISDRWILTAAHCLEEADEVTIHLGYLNLYDEDEEGRLKFLVRDGAWKMHPRYHTEGFANDIGLIQLPEAVKFTNNIRPVAISVDQSIVPNMEVIVIGNGATGDRQFIGTSKTVESAILSTITMTECKDAFLSLRYSCTSFCARDTSGSLRSICAGDSGMFIET